MSADVVAPPTSAPATAPVAAPPAPPPSKEPAARGGRGPTTPPVVETAPVEPPKPEKPKADEWAKLTAAEKRTRKDAEALAAERRAFAEERKGIESQKERLSLIDKAKAGDWDARQALMKETGLTYDELTKRVLAGGKVDKGETALQRIDRLEAELKARDEKSAADAQSQSFAATCETFARHVTKETPEAYPILAGEIESNRPWVDSVIKEMLDESAKAGRTLTYAEAAGTFETYLRTETERRAARLRPAEPPPPPAEEATKTSDETRPRDTTGRFAGGDGPRRLTNRDSAASAAPRLPEISTRRLTPRERDQQERERIKRAAAVMPRR